MSKFIPFEKLSKKKKKEIASKQRASWGGLNPVTRKPPNPKAYNRKKAGKWKGEFHDLPYLFSLGKSCS